MAERRVPQMSRGDTDFDRWRDFYAKAIEDAVPFLPQDHDFYVRTKADELVELIERRLGPPEGVCALDVGCGIGLLHRHLIGRIGALEGIDVAERTIAQARRANPEVRYRVADGERLPSSDASVDLAFAMGVVHHVPPSRWHAFLAELVRVTRPGGLVAVVEPNSLNPISKLGASRCEFDRDATFVRASSLRQLAEGAGLRDLDVRYILFVPWNLPFRRPLERGLRRVPVGAQYLLSGRVITPAPAPA